MRVLAALGLAWPAAFSGIATYEWRPPPEPDVSPISLRPDGRQARPPASAPAPPPGGADDGGAAPVPAQAPGPVVAAERGKDGDDEGGDDRDGSRRAAGEGSEG